MGWLREEAEGDVNQYFGKPFVSRSDELNKIQLSSGSHAIRHTSWNQAGHVVPRVASENGAALVITQQSGLGNDLHHLVSVAVGGFAPHS
jgi:hypothetical protein